MVNSLYQAVVKQGEYSPLPRPTAHPSSVTKLNDIRDDNTTYNNRVDTTLADVFTLLSLCYLTLGRTKECPAVYSQLASIRVSAAHIQSPLSLPLPSITPYRG